MASMSSAIEQRTTSGDDETVPEPCEDQENETAEESALLISSNDSNMMQRPDKAIHILTPSALTSSVCTIILVLVTFIVTQISQPCK